MESEDTAGDVLGLSNTFFNRLWDSANFASWGFSEVVPRNGHLADALPLVPVHTCPR